MTIQMFGTRSRDGLQVYLPSSYRTRLPWAPKLGDLFPDFAANTTHGKLRFREWAQGSWVFLFSHPAACTPVCTTELAGIARNADLFAQRNVKLMTVTHSSMAEIEAWFVDIRNLLVVEPDFPAVSDPEGTLTRICGMIHPSEDGAQPIRKSFIIDPRRHIRMVFEYPIRVGRSIDETLRVIDALQEVDRLNVATPANWRPGETLLLPQDMSDSEANARFGSSWEKLSHYLRFLRR